MSDEKKQQAESSDEQAIDALAEQIVEQENLKKEVEQLDEDDGRVPRGVIQKYREETEKYKAQVEMLEREKQERLAQERERSIELDEQSGDFKKVIASQREEIDRLRAELKRGELNVTRLMIGREYGFDDDASLLIPGDDEDIIKNNAERLVAGVNKRRGSGILDGAQTSNGSGSASTESTARHSLLDNAL